MVADYDLAIRNLGTIVGLSVLEYGESTEPGIGRRGGMAWAGGQCHRSRPTHRRRCRSFQFVSRHGGGMHSIALQVEDLEATMAHLHSGRSTSRPARARDMCLTISRHRWRLLPVEHLRACGRSPFRWSPAPDPLPRSHGSWPRPPSTPSSARRSTTPGSPGPPTFATLARHHCHLRGRPGPRRVSRWPASRSATAPSPSSRCPGDEGPRAVGPCCTSAARTHLVAAQGGRPGAGDRRAPPCRHHHPSVGRPTSSCWTPPPPEASRSPSAGHSSPATPASELPGAVRWRDRPARATPVPAR